MLHCRHSCAFHAGIFSPTPHFVAFSQGVLYRGAGLDVVWPEIAKIVAIGVAYFAVALARFRKVIFA